MTYLFTILKFMKFAMTIFTSTADITLVANTPHLNRIFINPTVKMDLLIKTLICHRNNTIGVLYTFADRFLGKEYLENQLLHICRRYFSVILLSN